MPSPPSPLAHDPLSSLSPPRSGSGSDPGAPLLTSPAVFPDIARRLRRRPRPMQAAAGAAPLGLLRAPPLRRRLGPDLTTSTPSTAGSRFLAVPPPLRRRRPRPPPQRLPRASPPPGLYSNVRVAFPLFPLCPAPPPVRPRVLARDAPPLTPLRGRAVRAPPCAPVHGHERPTIPRRARRSRPSGTYGLVHLTPPMAARWLPEPPPLSIPRRSCCCAASARSPGPLRGSCRSSWWPPAPIAVSPPTTWAGAQHPL